MAKVIKNPYVIDLGNGFTKRTTDGKEIRVDPSVLAARNDDYDSFTNANYIKLYDRNVHIGEYAIISGQKLIDAIGKGGKRYEKQEFKEMFYGFIAQDFKQDVTLNNVVAGLPVNEFKKVYKQLKELIEGRSIVSVNGDDVLIEIKNLIILPQPIGTYTYLYKYGMIEDNARVIVVDGGHGDLDITEMQGQNLVKWHGDKIGANKAFGQIVQYLKEEYPELENLETYVIKDFLINGMPLGPTKIDIKDDEKIKKILAGHFQDIINFAEKNFNLDLAQYIIFTGGISDLHRELIQAYFDRPNVFALEDGQVVNVKGFFEAGKDMVAGANTVNS